MQLVQFADFRPTPTRRQRAKIEWLDPVHDDADEPLWAVWDSACRQYRVDYNADSDLYTPMVTVEDRRGDRVVRIRVPVGCPQPTFEQAVAVLEGL